MEKVISSVFHKNQKVVVKGRRAIKQMLYLGPRPRVRSNRQLKSTKLRRKK
jgi:hypothetical protein